MPAELLRATAAAKRLGLPTKELLRLVYERKIRYVMVEASPTSPRTPSRTTAAAPRPDLVSLPLSQPNPGMHIDPHLGDSVRERPRTWGCASRLVTSTNLSVGPPGPRVRSSEITRRSPQPTGRGCPSSVPASQTIGAAAPTGPASTISPLRKLPRRWTPNTTCPRRSGRRSADEQRRVDLVTSRPHEVGPGERCCGLDARGPRARWPAGSARSPHRRGWQPPHLARDALDVEALQVRVHTRERHAEPRLQGRRSHRAVRAR